MYQALLDAPRDRSKVQGLFVSTTNEQGPAPAGAPEGQSEASRGMRAGVLYALGAFGMWGLVVPVHFKLLSAASPMEIFSQRIIWASLIGLFLIAATRRIHALTSVFFQPRRLGLLCLSASALGLNWFMYIWAVNSDQLIETSLGYFINP